MSKATDDNEEKEASVGQPIMFTLVSMAVELNRAELNQQLEQAGLLQVLKARPSQTYPYTVFINMIMLLSSYKYPNYPPTEQLFQLGRDARHAYAQKTIIGQVQLAASTVTTPGRNVYRSRDVQNSMFPYKRTVTEISPTNYRLVFHGDPSPADYWRGLLYEALVVGQAKHPRVVVLPRREGGFELDAKWE